MVTIQASLNLHDGMTGSLKTITNTMDIVINTFESMERISSHPIEAASLRDVREGLVRVNIGAVNLEQNLKAAAHQQENFKQKIRESETATGKLGNKINWISGVSKGLKGVRMGVRFVADSISLQTVQSEAETKVGAIMRQRMGAGPEEIQSIKSLTATQQNLGVVSDEVQLSGARQLATFLNSSGALNTLIPAMNNLAVHQNGVNVSVQDAVDIGNRMGEVMQGQVGVLTNIGITFSEAQGQVLKYGSELERATTLSEIITSNVGNMNAIMATTPQGQIQQMANAWRDIKEAVGARLYPAVMQFFTTLHGNLPQVENLVMGFASALIVAITVMSRLAYSAGEVITFFQNGWSIIEPIIWGIVGVLGVYLLATKGIQVAEAAGAAVMAAYHAVQTFLSIGFGILTGNTAAASAAVMTYNSALMACPITWIVIGIIALIAIIYAIVGAVNMFMNTTISATGIIAGAVAVLGAFIINTFVIPLRNIIAQFINFFYNVWTHPIAAVNILFLDLAGNVIAYVVNMAHAIEAVINKIPGVHVDITSGLDNFQKKVESATAKVKSEAEWKEIVKTKDLIDYVDTAKGGYNFGVGIDDHVKGFLDGKGLEMPDFGGAGGAQETWDNIAGNTGNTAGNTAAMADSVNMMDEDLKYMRDMAEQEIINRFTTAELTVNMGGITNQISGQMDLDGISDYLGNVIFETLDTAAEGAY